MTDLGKLRRNGRAGADPAITVRPRHEPRPGSEDDFMTRVQLALDLTPKQLANVLLAKEPSTIQVRNADGSGARELGDPKQWSYYPDWSKDGKLIALSVSPQHHEGEDWDLAIVSTDGSRPLQKLTTGPGNDRLPDWRP